VAIADGPDVGGALAVAQDVAGVEVHHPKLLKEGGVGSRRQYVLEAFGRSLRPLEGVAAPLQDWCGTFVRTVRSCRSTESS
jgi:hypothetical protein